jgi:hypothetical protein
MKSMILVIESIDKRDTVNGEPVFWSGEDGWVSLDSAEMFTNFSEIENMNMPMGGRLMPIDKAITKISTHFCNQ